MPAHLRFCGACGAALVPSDGPRPSEERKVVSVLFADLAASTELATRLDPEDLRRLYTSYFDAMSEVLDRHGGTVEKFIGDAVVGIFGAPVTHEDDPERAVRAGLEMQAKLHELNQRLAGELGEELALRIGIHTGEVLATPGDSSQALVTGETTSIAARLQAIAPRGGVIVGGRTRRDAARSFVFDGLGDVDLKGVPEPIDAWIVVGDAPTVGPHLDQPLVGRSDELALLDVLLRRCEREGSPHLITVVGPAGIGKSRLILEFTNASPVPVVRGRCLPYGSGLHLWPFAEIVKEDASILDSDPPDVIESKARERIGRRFTDTDGYGVTLSTLLSSIGIPIDPDPLAGVGREAALRMITNAWSEYLSALASTRPLIAWIEDLHWADEALLELMDRLLDRIAAPVLFVCLARPDLLERRPTWATRGASMTTFDLTPLSPTDSVSLVAGLLEGPVDPDLAEVIADRAGGNPFFARELVHILTEEDSIQRRDGMWVATADVGAVMPDTVQAAIAARIDRLEPSEKSVIQMASIVGRTFWVPGPDELSDEHVDTAIDAMIARSLIRPRSTSSIAGSSEFSFEHALTRDVAYGSIPRSRRTTGHRSVLDWMERGTRGRDEEFAEVMAHHAQLGGDPERTARFAVLAGHRHRRVYAAEEAIRWYERAAVALEQVAEERMGGVRAELLHSRGEAFDQLGRYDEARSDYERALDMARAKKQPWFAAQELSALANVFRSLDRPDDAEATIPLALGAAREAGFHYLEARVMCLAGALAWDRGDAMQARREHDEALRIAQQARDLEAEAYARTGLTEIGLCQGPFGDAIADGERARGLWLRLGHRPLADSVAQMLGYLRLLTGDVSGAGPLFERSLIGARELGIGRDEPLPLVGLALVAMTRGDLGRGLTHLGEAIETASSNRATRGEVAARLARVVLLQELGASERAAADLGAVDALMPATASYLRSIRLAARGWLSLAAGEREDATTAFARARSGAEGLLLSRIAAGRIEILAWSAARDEAAMSDAAAWLLDGIAGTCPAAEALAGWALARSRRGDAAAATALDLARRADDRTLLWRTCLVAAREAQELGNAELATRLEDEARGIVHTIADSLRHGELRASYLSGSEAAELMRNDPTRP